MRPPVLIALFFALSGFILGLLTLLAGSTVVGSTNGFMTYACILQYNTSPTMYTTLHILSICSTTPTSTICTIIRSGLNPSTGKSLRSDGGGPPFAPTGMVLIIGLGLQIGACGLAVLGLPWLIGGKRHWNGFFVPILALGAVGGTIASAAGSNYALGQTHIATGTASTNGAVAPIEYSPVWIGMLWAGFFCPLIAAAMELIERNMERFTPEGLVIKREYKPKEVPWWVWNFWLRRSA